MGRLSCSASAASAEIWVLSEQTLQPGMNDRLEITDAPLEDRELALATEFSLTSSSEPELLRREITLLTSAAPKEARGRSFIACSSAQPWRKPYDGSRDRLAVTAGADSWPSCGQPALTAWIKAGCSSANAASTALRAA